MNQKQIIREGEEAARSCNPKQFKHSEARKIRRGLLAAIKRLEAFETQERSTVEEF